ncbi:Protein VirD4 [compost metagenome]
MARTKAPQYSPENPQQKIDQYPGLLIGKHPRRNQFLCSYGQTFVLLAAPPGTGKGVGIVIPNLLTYPDSVVVNDPKFENWEKTAGFRASTGHQVFRFSPERLETHRWNPLGSISRDENYRLGEIRTMARVLFVSENPKNQEWYNKAADVFVALVLYLMETPEVPCTFPQIYEFAVLGTGLGAWALQALSERQAGPRPLSEECFRELNGVYQASKNTSSGWSTTMDILRGVFSMYGERTVAWAVSGDDIDFAKARETRMSVYFCCTNDALKKFAALMNLFFSQAIKLNSKVLPEYGGHCPDGSLRLKHQLLFLIDELAIMGRMEEMETAPALTRGAGLRFLVIFQDKDQLRADRCYGREAADGIMKAFHIEVVYAPGDPKLAKEYSERLGNTTVRVMNESFNRGKHGSRTLSYSYQPRPLMLPQEIDAMPYHQELIFIQGTTNAPPAKVKARKIKYYEEPALRDRAGLPPPPVPVGDEALLKTLTVPIRIGAKPIAVQSPHAEDIQQEQMRRHDYHDPPNN